MATKSPTAVAMSASAIPPITLSIWILFEPSARSAKATMTPMTVPSRPTNGALLPSVPRRVMPLSSSFLRRIISPSIPAASASGPPCAQRRDASSTSASIAWWRLRRPSAAWRSPVSRRSQRASPSSSPPRPCLRKNHHRSTITAIEATLSASSTYITHALPSIATLSRYLTTTAIRPFLFHRHVLDEERWRAAARHLTREELAAPRRDRVLAALRARPRRLVEREREV